MSLRLPPLNAVRAFEAAARMGSYVAAAADLHVTQPAIGRHIKLLEDWLGVTLFQRTARGVVLTSAGQQYYASISNALQQIADAGLALQQTAAERWLRLRVVPGLASRWLLPQLPALQALRPGLRLAIEPHATFNRLDPQTADIAIGFGEPADFNGRCETLIEPAIYPVCTAHYLQQAPSLQQPLDLLQHTLIHEDDGWWWQHWLSAQGLNSTLRADLSYLSFEHALDQVLAGRGIALANDLLVGPLLAEGRLIKPLEQESVLQGYQLLLPDKPLSSDQQWFCEWLRQALGSHADLQNQRQPK